MSGYLDTIRTIVFFWINILCLQTKAANDEEYCANETFEPKCNSNEVILMEHALYGRMKMGRCVNVDVGSCSEDVLKWMDKECSGKRQCEVEIPSRGLNELVLCTKIYMPYLEASYSCIPVVNPNRQGGCSNSFTITVISQHSTIASSVSKITHCGLPSSPWSLQAKPGQKINITMIDFNWLDDSKDNYNQCNVKYGYVIDIHAHTTDNEVIDICGGTSRYKTVYISTGNLVQIILQEEIVQQHNFLIQVKAIGCPDFNPPRNAWMRKEPNRVTIGCHGSNNPWVLTCQETRWIGKYDSCPEDVPVAASSDESGPGLSNVISLTLIGGSTVVICCVTMTSIIVCFCYRKYRIEKPDTEYYTTTVTGGNSAFPLQNGTIVSYKTYRPVSTVDNRQTLASTRSVNANNPFQGDTLSRQNINTNTTIQEGSNIIDEVIYDDPANLDINNVQYMNQFNSLNSTGTGMVNSLQYTKLQKQRQ